MQENMIDVKNKLEVLTGNKLCPVNIKDSCLLIFTKENGEYIVIDKEGKMIHEINGSSQMYEYGELLIFNSELISSKLYVFNKVKAELLFTSNCDHKLLICQNVVLFINNVLYSIDSKGEVVTKMKLEIFTEMLKADKFKIFVNTKEFCYYMTDTLKILKVLDGNFVERVKQGRYATFYSMGKSGLSRVFSIWNNEYIDSVYYNKVLSVGKDYLATVKIRWDGMNIQLLHYNGSIVYSEFLTNQVIGLNKFIIFTENGYALKQYNGGPWTIKNGSLKNAMFKSTIKSTYTVSNFENETVVYMISNFSLAGVLKEGNIKFKIKDSQLEGRMDNNFKRLT